MRRTVTIDVVSDAVCPWCFIGKKKLDMAMAAMPDVAFDVRWRPYQLDATIPPGGLPRREYMERKFGAERLPAIHDTLREAGRDVGLAFDFEKIAVSPNTLDAHRLIRWAQSNGAQTAVVERLFEMFFLEGRDIGDAATLTDAAVDAGMEKAVVERLLSGDADADAVREEIGVAQRLGVTGVPFFIFDGRIGVSGAQPPEILQQAIAQALDSQNGEV
jgi:predicted DsbA family dithiol-disulfide isomerase